MSALARELSKADTEANTLDSLGYLAQGTGDHALAVQHYRHGADLQHRYSDTYSQAQTLEHLGDAQAALGDRVAAAKAWRQALRLYRTQRRTSDAERVSRNPPPRTDTVAYQPNHPTRDRSAPPHQPGLVAPCRAPVMARPQPRA